MNTQYPSYLIHYNKNHSKANGQFVSGDGDGDGIANDHANDRKKKTAATYNEKIAKGGKRMGLGKGLIWGSVGGAAATGALSGLAEAFDSEIAAAASWVSALGTVALLSVGSSTYASGRKMCRDAADDAFLDSVGVSEESRKYLSDAKKYREDDNRYGYY